MKKYNNSLNIFRTLKKDNNVFSVKNSHNKIEFKRSSECLNNEKNNK